MKDKQKICLLLASDEHYLPMLAALIKSLESNIDKSYNIEIWIVADGISAENKSKIEISINTEITLINWIDALTQITNFVLPIDKSTFPLNIYYWMFFPKFIPNGIDKLIYMDVDMLNYRNIAELWNVDLDDKIVGAVPDARIRTFDCWWGGIKNFETLGFSGNIPYFNSGLLVIDVRKWKQSNITEKTFLIVKENIQSAVFPEQYGLNIALVNNWIELDPLWNSFASTHYKTPYNIHFVDRKPIYLSYKNNPSFKHEFIMHINKTAWQFFQPYSEIKRWRKKLHNVLIKEIIRLKIKLGFT